MVTSNYHIHSTYCDGKNSLEEMVIAAIQSGLNNIGFSGHAPLPYENDWTMTEENINNYICDVKALKKKYQNKIKISLGLEIEYFIKTENITPFTKAILPKLDFFIGSIHVIGKTHRGIMADIDYTPEIFKEGIKDCFDGSAQKFIEAYYQAIGKMANQIHPDIIGHMDLIKKNNENNLFFDESAPWYKKAVKDCLKQIKAAGSIVEINTGGMIRYGDRCQYPSVWMMEAIKTLEIPITLNGDSHSVEGIAYAYLPTTALLKKIGFEEIMILENGEWIAEVL